MCECKRRPYPSPATIPGKMARTRRTLLTQLGAVGGMGVLAQRASAQSTGTDTESSARRATIRAVIPTKQTFAGNYLGQILLFNHLEAESVEQPSVGNCEFATWSPEETNRYVGMLTDRLRERPRSVETEIYTNGSREGTIEVGTVGIVNRTQQCSGDVIGLEVETFNPAAVRGLGAGDATQTATETTTGSGPGFGILAGALGIGGAALARLFGGED